MSFWAAPRIRPAGMARSKPPKRVTSALQRNRLPESFAVSVNSVSTSLLVPIPLLVCSNLTESG